eukprot:scaffold242476_cov23-Prasinocladus_malaysianus.AAC.2
MPAARHGKTGFDSYRSTQTKKSVCGELRMSAMTMMRHSANLLYRKRQYGGHEQLVGECRDGRTD